jgi:hypothetical protein
MLQFSKDSLGREKPLKQQTNRLTHVEHTFVSGIIRGELAVNHDFQAELARWEMFAIKQGLQIPDWIIMTTNYRHVQKLGDLNLKRS